MRVILLACGPLLAVATACGSADSTNTSSFSHIAPSKVAAITKDFDSWYHYTYYKVRLSRDFIALDTSGQTLPKKAFLCQLATGKVVALPLVTKHSSPVYQLCVYSGINPDIRETSKQSARVELSNCSRVGQQLPTTELTDLNGVTYTKNSMRGKIVVLKFWYTSCVACIDEFPQINALVEKYKQDQAILFISLAMNDAKTLRTFIKGRQIEFAVIPAKKSYLIDTLKVAQYPTHFIIGKEGNIIKVTTNADDLAVALEKEIHFTK